MKVEPVPSNKSVLKGVITFSPTLRLTVFVLPTIFFQLDGLPLSGVGSLLGQFLTAVGNTSDKSLILLMLGTPADLLIVQ